MTLEEFKKILKDTGWEVPEEYGIQKCKPIPNYLKYEIKVAPNTALLNDIELDLEHTTYCEETGWMTEVNESEDHCYIRRFKLTVF